MTLARRTAFEQPGGSGWLTGEAGAQPSRHVVWRSALPVLASERVTLRGLRVSDAPSLLASMNASPVLQYIAPSPDSVEGFRHFIRWTLRRQRLGLHVCFGIVPSGEQSAAGLVQLWGITGDLSTAEWGFALDHRHWGTGLFMETAGLFLDFAFGRLDVQRLEARTLEANLRGVGVLRKLGAQPEGRLRRSFRRGSYTADHVMWSLLAEDWYRARMTSVDE